MTVIVLPEAELEAAEAIIWYDDQRFGLGQEFLDELRQVLDRIGGGPAEQSRLENYAGPHDVRRCLLKRFPYSVVFACRPDAVLIVAVSHVRRQPLYWLDRLN